VIVRFLDLGGIDYHYSLEVIACFVDLHGIDYHCRLQVTVCFADLDGIDEHCCSAMGINSKKTNKTSNHH
jgi:hypothetical protein